MGTANKGPLLSPSLSESSSKEPTQKGDREDHQELNEAYSIGVQFSSSFKIEPVLQRYILIWKIVAEKYLVISALF